MLDNGEEIRKYRQWFSLLLLLKCRCSFEMDNTT